MKLYDGTECSVDEWLEIQRKRTKDEKSEESRNPKERKPKEGNQRNTPRFLIEDFTKEEIAKEIKRYERSRTKLDAWLLEQFEPGVILTRAKLEKRLAIQPPANFDRSQYAKSTLPAMINNGLQYLYFIGKLKRGGSVRRPHFLLA